VAEGVETKDAYDALVAMGCDAAQGYYLSRPLPAADLEQWLATSGYAP
jgi:EAL domain-containing protein (putative c-di-GMP-specific phosphodiesterase class I)